MAKKLVNMAEFKAKRASKQKQNRYQAVKLSEMSLLAKRESVQASKDENN
ncbi:hypothetical protein [Alicyclobacillus ferrooxydans]|nr:hypothetical protein [Alicyclobacillus ferrooxydans]